MREETFDTEYGVSWQIRNGPRGCVMCGISLALREYHSQLNKEDYYGLKLLKLCLEKHFDSLVKYVSIQGRSLSSFGMDWSLPRVSPDFANDLCYKKVSGGPFRRTGGTTLVDDYSSVPCIRLVQPDKSLHSIKLDLPADYEDILRRFKETVKERVLSDKTNEAVKLSHMQESSCNESDFTNFACGFVYHAIYVR